MTPDEEFLFSQLKNRLHSEHERVSATLLSELLNLQVRVKNAIESLRDGKGLDAHLVVNAAGITESIARWNMVRDLIPYTNPEVAKATEKKTKK